MLEQEGMFEDERIRRNCADVSLHSLKQKNCKNECIAEAFSSRRETAAFPAQYGLSPWCTDPQSLWVHREEQHILQDLGGNMERKKNKDKDLNLRFMFLFWLTQKSQKGFVFLSLAQHLNHMHSETQTASSSDSFRMHAFATCTSPFQLYGSCCTN